MGNQQKKAPRPFVTPAADVSSFIRGIADATIDAGGQEEDLALAIGDGEEAAELRQQIGKLCAAAGEKQRDPEIRRQRLVAALNAAAIQIPALQRPTLPELQARWSFIREIESDTSPEGPVTLQLSTVFKDGEERIDGPEYERRLKALVGQFGFQQLGWLVQHQDDHPSFQALLGLIYLDGPAIIVVSRGGDRLVAFLSQCDERWCLHWHWLRSGFNRSGVVAVSGK